MSILGYVMRDIEVGNQEDSEGRIDEGQIDFSS